MALLAAYSFDEVSGDALDASGNGHDFSLGANGIRAAGHTNTAATKSGAGLIPLPAGLLAAVNASTNRTIMAWLKGTGAAWYVRCQHNDIDSGGWGIVTLDGGSTIGIRVRNAGGENHSAIAIPAGGADWYHIAGTYDGTNLRTYINGTLVDTRAFTAPLRSDADILDMMEWTDNATLVDDLRFYDEALDQATIAALMDTPVTEGPPEITGDAAFTSPAGELAATVTVTVAGTVDLASPAAVLDASGSTVVAGTAALASPAGQLAAAGGVLVDGAAELVSPATQLAAAGLVAITGTAAFTAPAAILAATDEAPHNTMLTATLAPQDSPTGSLGPRRWTATLGSQP